MMLESRKHGLKDRNQGTMRFEWVTRAKMSSLEENVVRVGWEKGNKYYLFSGLNYVPLQIHMLTS